MKKEKTRRREVKRTQITKECCERGENIETDKVENVGKGLSFAVDSRGD